MRRHSADRCPHHAAWVLAAVLAAVPIVVHAQASSSAAAGSKAASSSSSEHHAHAMHQSMIDSMKEMQSMQPTGNLDHDLALPQLM